MHMLISLALLGIVTCLKNEPDLWVDDNGQFKVMQITDIHYGEHEEKDNKTTKLMEDLIQWEKPDICVLTGDMVSGYQWDGKTEGWYKSVWKRWTEAFVNQKQRYMYIQGNHDSQGDLDRDEVTDVDTELDISLTEKGPASINGSTNYIKAVYDHTKTKKLFYLWAFDSMSNNCEGVQGWGCIYPSQIAWYKEQSKKLIEEDGKILPGFAFFHIPLPEYQDMWNLNTVYGQKNEGISCQAVDTGLYAAFKEIKNIQAVFCGHDHDNDFWGDYNGIQLFYGRKTGHGGYGPMPFFWRQRGARIIEFNTTKSGDVIYSSWIREENGAKKTQNQWPTWAKIKQSECAGKKPHEDKFVADLHNIPYQSSFSLTSMFKSTAQGFVSYMYE